MAKNRNSPQKRLFKADSEKFEDVLWISSNNPREAKALLKQYLLSPCFWETDQEISEYQGEMAREMYKAYQVHECPGIKVDPDVRGQVFPSLNDSSTDWIWQK